MPGRTAKARKTKPPRDRSMLLGPAPDFDTLESAMQDPDVAHDMVRASQIRVAAALVYLNDRIGAVLDATICSALKGNTMAAKLLMEVTGIKKTGRGARTPQNPEGEIEDGADTEEFDRILENAAKVLPIGSDREGTGGH